MYKGAGFKQTKWLEKSGIFTWRSSYDIVARAPATLIANAKLPFRSYQGTPWILISKDSLLLLMNGRNYNVQYGGICPAI